MNLRRARHPGRHGQIVMDRIKAFARTFAMHHRMHLHRWGKAHERGQHRHGEVGTGPYLFWKRMKREPPPVFIPAVSCRFLPGDTLK